MGKRCRAMQIGTWRLSRIQVLKARLEVAERKQEKKSLPATRLLCVWPNNAASQAQIGQPDERLHAVRPK